MKGKQCVAKIITVSCVLPTKSNLYFIKNKFKM